ncbi:unnamed protein product [Clavelina lepadiformis]|uniref:UDENN domain-containing protein n=1 Tax=Clavelina lepadiformis TaxID=159417 RepID=A0ABP0GI42_CLALP
MAKEKQTCENSSGSRLRENVSRIFDCFLVATRPVDRESDLVPDYKYPADFNDEEILQQSLLFCFPFLRSPDTVTTFKERANHFTFILTDIEGKHRFGFCKLVDDGTKCYCVLSFVPWFDIFGKILNYAHELSSQTGGLEAMLENLYLQSVPDSNQTVKVNSTLSFQVPDANSLPSIPENRNVSEYYAAVNIGFMMDIFANIMLERRILFTSKSLSILTSCIHSAEALLRPLHWQHIYIPVMPPHLLDYCLAPMPYLIGVHSSLIEKVRGMISMDDDVIVADIDKEEIESIHNDMERIPNDAMSFLKSLLKKQTIAIGTNLSMAFLRTQARLIGGYRNGLKFKPGEPILFDEGLFIEHFRSNTEKEFAHDLVQMQTFKQFVDGRLDMLNAGVGFRDSFENEVNMLDAISHEKDPYKEWLSAAKKGGNIFITQFKRKAKDNMKFARQNFRDAMKQQQQQQQQHSSPSLRKKSLDETTHRMRPARPPSISPSTADEQKVQRSKPPRPPPPQFSNRPRNLQNKSFKNTHKRTTRHYNSLDLSDDDNVDNNETRPKSISVLSSVQEEERERTLSDLYNRVDVNLMDDFQVAMDNITRNNSLTSPSSPNPIEPDLLLELGNGATSPNKSPHLSSLEENSESWPHRSSEIRRSAHVHTRPSLRLKGKSNTGYSSDDLTPSPDNALDNSFPSTPLVDLSITSTLEKKADLVESARASASSTCDDLLGLDFDCEANSSMTAISSGSSKKWVAFDDDEVKPPPTAIDRDSVILEPQNINPSSSENDVRPNKLSPEKFNPFKTARPAVPKSTNVLSEVELQKTAGSVSNRTSYFNDLQTLSFPVAHPQNPPNASPQTRSTSFPAAGRITNPVVNKNLNLLYSQSQDFKNSDIPRSYSNPGKPAPLRRAGTVWQRPAASKFVANGELVRTNSLNQNPSNDKELFSDLLGSWKTKEGL